MYSTCRHSITALIVYPAQALAGAWPWLDQSIAGATQTLHRQSATYRLVIMRPKTL